MRNPYVVRLVAVSLSLLVDRRDRRDLPSSRFESLPRSSLYRDDVRSRDERLNKYICWHTNEM
jgi:hypothetical protein